jgi:hypothetical protein
MVYFQKMQTKFFTQFLSLFIIVQLLIAPISFVFAEGEDSAGGTPGFDSSISGYNGGDVNTSPDTGGDTVLGQSVDSGSGAATASQVAGNFGGFSSLLGCKNADSRALGGAFGAIGGLFAKKAASSGTGKAVSKTLGLSSMSSDAVPTTNADLQKTADANLAKTSDLDKLATADSTRNNCLNGLAYRIAKYALAKLTKQTVNWINSGFNGDAFFIKNQDSYMKSLVNQQANSILGPIGLYSNRNNYPYGRDFARAYLQHQKNTYNMYAQSNLSHYFNKYMTPAQYSGNFMGGGWNGWLALTQNPANNPLGFGMITSQQIADNAARVTNDATNELNWGDGFLSQKKCIDPADYTQKDSKKNPCKEWKTVTPGIAISNQLSNAMGSSYRQLEMADQINESMSVVFDALVNQAMTMGISELSSKKDPAFTTFGGPGSNKIYDSLGNDITNRNSKNYDANGVELPTPQPGGWFDSDVAFDITSTQNSTNNLAQVLLTQKLYKLQLQKSVEPLPQIVPKLAELDYCIPGPHPGWENDVADEIDQQNQAIDELIKNGSGNLKDYDPNIIPSWLETLNTWPVIGEVTGLISGIASGIHSIYYRATYGENPSETQPRLEAIKEAESNLQDNLISYAEQFQPAVTQQEFNDYKDAIHKYYGDNLYEKNIPVALKANSLISNISGYKDSVNDALIAYNDGIAATDVNIAQLTEIKKKVDAIVAPYKKNFTYCPAPFDPKIKDGLYTPGNTTGGTTIKDVFNPAVGGAVKGATNGGTTIDKAVKAGAAGTNIQ